MQGTLQRRTYLAKAVESSGWLLAERLTRHVLGFLTGIWVARYLGPGQYGLLNYAAATVGLLSFLSTLGLDNIALREMVRQPQRRAEILGTLLTLRLVGGFALVSVAALGGSLVSGDSHAARAMIVIISVAQLVLAFDSIDCWFQAAVRVRPAATARLFVLFTMAAVRLVLVWIGAPLIAFAWMIALESACSAAAMWLTLRLSGKPNGSLRPTTSAARLLMAEGWPLMLSAMLATLCLRIDQVLLGRLAGFDQLGPYVIAVRVVDVCYSASIAITSIALPAMVLARQNDPVTYNAQVQRLFDTLLWAGIALALPISFFAPTIVRILVGPAYAAAGPLLSIMAWLPVFVFASHARQKWLVAEHRPMDALLVDAAGFIGTIAACLILIPRYGAVGAAWACLLAVIVAPWLAAPFSRAVRQSLGLQFRAWLAPVRLLRPQR